MLPHVTRDSVGPPAGGRVDEEFLAMPRAAIADAAISRGRALGASHVDVRVARLQSQHLALRDASLDSLHRGEDVGMAVRVVVDGAWGFAATSIVAVDEVPALVARAVDVARVCRPLIDTPVELAPEPVADGGQWVSAYAVDPFAVPDAEKIDVLAEYSRRVLAAPGVEHVLAHLEQVKEQTFYADHHGTAVTQQRVRLHPVLDAVGLGPDDTVETMRTLAAPAGRGFEYVTGADGVHDWAHELATLPEHLAEKLRAPSVAPGRYDLVIDPTNLWLTIHESVGHATELDRALGYEAAYAGTSFATLDQLGTLRYGSPAMHIVADRTTPHGLSTVGWDDEGVAAQSWDLVREGVLVGYQLDRRMAAANAAALGVARSNGCAYADSPHSIPMQRMPNVSLQPDPRGPDLAGLLAGVEHGIYVVGDKSWSIDMQRYNFQFTGQRFYRIEHGRLAGQVKDVAYQSRTPDFWAALEAVGGPDTYLLGGAFNCGKGQPGQVAPVSHGAPLTLFRGINVLNTVQEGSR
jgi:TldD protein